MKSARRIGIGLLVTVMMGTAAAETRSVFLDEMDLGLIRQGWGEAQSRKSVEKRPLRLGGVEYERGVGSHAPTTIYVELDGQTERFKAVAGVDDETNGRGSVSVMLYGDGKELFRSAVLKGGEAPANIDLELSGIRQLTIAVKESTEKESFDHADIAIGEFITRGGAPKLVTRPAFFESERVMRTPKPPREPRINGARIYGVRPGSPFLFRIPATGERPMAFSAKDLPAGLTLDADTGIISGIITDQTPETYRVTLAAKNGAGAAERDFRIVVGDTIALTPPMGWNHWYAHYDRITDAMMREAADIMVSSGMADVGYQYVDIDDCWMNRPKHEDPKRVGPLRGDNGEILPNAYFPDMYALTDYIHAKGLKAGIYTSPGPFTCGGFTGSWDHEAQDAATFAEWGFDFLKYDWCSYSEKAKDKSLEELQKPYLKMSAILKQLRRDIVFNFCQYGMGDVWEWGAEAGGNCWRTAGDLGFELDRFYGVARRNAEHWPCAKPGAWNDPDYLLIGYVGNAAKMGEPVACTLSPNEQYSYMSLWSMMAAPLFFSGDMTRLDAFTLNVLCNPEVIAINQDPLGKQGHPVVVREAEDIEIWSKPLEDGSLCAGLFNLSEGPQDIAVAWNEIGVTGKQRIRDLWRQSDLGVFDETFKAPLGRHDVLLIRLCPEK